MLLVQGRGHLCPVRVHELGPTMQRLLSVETESLFKPDTSWITSDTSWITFLFFKGPNR